MKLTLESGESCALLRTDDAFMTLRTPVPFAPGTRVDARLESGRKVRFKVHRCQRDAEAFVLTGRFIDLTREVREHIEAALAAG